MKFILSILAFFSFCGGLSAQSIANPPSSKWPMSSKDTLFKPLDFVDYSKRPTTEFLPEWKDGVVFAGKSTFEVSIKNLQVDATGNAARQWMAKVPGMSVWESDASGLNTSISTRGWSPNRSWDLNVRMDGFDIASDPLGYPEAYYAPPTEFISQIQIIKGAGALAYGTQFGGFVNYITAQPGYKKFQYNGSYSVGSFNTESAMHSFHGSLGKWKYGAWLHQRTSDGWRDNSGYKTQNGMFKVSRALRNDFIVQLQYIKHLSTAQQAGGLTDAQWLADASISNRDRNWFQLDWQVLGLDITQKKDQHYWSTKLSYMQGIRNSVGFLKALDKADDLSNRQLDLDTYRNWMLESRYSYFITKTITWNTGLRGFKGHTDRLRDEKGGTSGNDADFSPLPGYVLGRNLDYASLNASGFTEMILQWKKLKFIPGLRYEWLQNSIEGRYSATFEVPSVTDNRKVFLYGAAMEYHLNDENEIVLNYNRSFRPVLFSELTPTGTTDVIDSNLKDAQGYNWDAFIRGKIFNNQLHYQLGAYYTMYGNKVGSYMDASGIRHVTNIGDAVSKGIESLVDYTFTQSKEQWSINVWAALSWMNVTYTSWNDPSIGPSELQPIGKRVENAPRYIHRCGINAAYKQISLQLNGNWVSEVYTDALNAALPNAVATTGLLPSYAVMDASLKYNFSKFIQGQLNVNNAMNERYATRRSGGYPGPGLLPGTPRSVTFTLALAL
jgi:Fe(3+) dicitrate transport protein